MVGVNALHNPRPTKHLQSPHMALDIGAIVAAWNAGPARLGAVDSWAIVG